MSATSISTVFPQPILIYAKLVPTSAEAQRLFSELAESVLSDPTNLEYVHNAKFLFVQPYLHNPSKPQMREWRQASLESQTATDTDDEIPSGPGPNYQGGYMLSFEANPLNVGIGWVIGLGRRSNKHGASPGIVDLLLAKPGTSSTRFGVAGKHARLFFDRNAILTLKVFNPRGNATALGNEEFSAGQRSIISQNSRVSFGSRNYSLEFTDLDQDEYNNPLRKYVEAYLDQEPTSSDISAAPSPMDTLTGDWNIRGTVGSGSFGVVNVAKNIKTGESGAAKCVIACDIAEQETSKLGSKRSHS